MTNVVEVNGVKLSDKSIKTLKSLQEGKNDLIQFYDEYLEQITDILFDIGKDAVVEKTKDEIFELLNTSHTLRKDLSDLKIPI